MGLATLAKGPVGFVLPTLTTTTYLIVQQKWWTIRGRDLLSCLCTYLAVTLGWYLPAVAEGGLAYLQATLFHHTLERYVQAWEHQAPWYFYLGAFPAEFLPWTLFLPQALVIAVTLRVKERAQRWWFALCWLGVILLFFSLSSGKRDIYILPAFPAAALLTGGVWAYWWDDSGSKGRIWAITIPVLTLALIFVGIGVAVWVGLPSLLPGRNSLLMPVTSETRLWAGVSLLLCGVLLAGLALTRHSHLGFAAIVGCTWLIMVLGMVYIYMPQFNRRYPIKSFTAAIRTAATPDTPLHLCGPMNDLPLQFYIGHFIPALSEAPQIVQYLHTDARVLCVIELASYQRLSEGMDRPWPIVARQDLDRTVLLLISSQP
jgi:4-amino-4-deoxy-L-arabinose transferase-like glycosyltransferase